MRTSRPDSWHRQKSRDALEQLLERLRAAGTTDYWAVDRAISEAWPFSRRVASYITKAWREEVQLFREALAAGKTMKELAIAAAAQELARQAARATTPVIDERQLALNLEVL